MVYLAAGGATFATKLLLCTCVSMTKIRKISAMADANAPTQHFTMASTSKSADPIQSTTYAMCIDKSTDTYFSHRYTTERTIMNNFVANVAPPAER